MLQKNKRNICYISVPVAPPESISKHRLWRFEVLTLTAKKYTIFNINLSFSSTLQKNKRKCCHISVPVAPPESISKHCLWWFEVLTLTAKTVD